MTYQALQTTDRVAKNPYIHIMNFYDMGGVKTTFQQNF
jgi:hypothetical protein